MVRSLFALCALFASTCQVGPFPPSPAPSPQPTPAPAPSPDPAPQPAPTPSSACAAACARFAALGCQEAKPTAAGASCVAVCQNAEDSGVISLGPDCVAHADSCASATACAFSVKR